MPKKQASQQEEEKKTDEEGTTDLDQFGEDLMTSMVQEGNNNESEYVMEYNEVISQISTI